MSAVDLPPGMGLAGTPLAVFASPKRSRRLALICVLAVFALGLTSWAFVYRHPWRSGSSVQVVLPAAFAVFGLIGMAVRSARLAVRRDGVRWGWSTLGFTQQASRVEKAHLYRDGITLQAKRGTWWFLAARDWDRFDSLVRQLRRTDMVIEDHEGKAPLRARMQSYGRFLDAMMLCAIAGSALVALWAS